MDENTARDLDTITAELTKAEAETERLRKERQAAREAAAEKIAESIKRLQAEMEALEVAPKPSKTTKGDREATAEEVFALFKNGATLNVATIRKLLGTMRTKKATDQLKAEGKIIKTTHKARGVDCTYRPKAA